MDIYGDNNLFEVYKIIRTKYDNAIPLIRHDQEYVTYGTSAILLEEKTGIETREGELGTEYRFNARQLDKIIGILIKHGYRIALADNTD